MTNSIDLTNVNILPSCNQSDAYVLNVGALRRFYAELNGIDGDLFIYIVPHRHTFIQNESTGTSFWAWSLDRHQRWVGGTQHVNQINIHDK